MLTNNRIKLLYLFSAFGLLAAALSVGIIFSINGSPNENKAGVDFSQFNGDQVSTLKVAMPSLREESFLGWNGGSGRKFYLDVLYEYLVYIDPESGDLVPGLAEAWEISKDGKKVSLRLRRGVHFNDGWGEFTARDVKFSLEQTIKPNSRAGPASTLREALGSVDVIDAYTLEIVLKTPDIDFVRGYLSNGQQVPMLSQHYLESVGEDKANANPTGTGAYLLESHQPGSSITFRSVLRNSNSKKQITSHWRLTPEFEQIIFYAVPSESTRVAMIRAGEIDIAPVSYDSMAALEKNGFQILSLVRNWAPVIRMGGIVKNNSKLYNPKVPWAKKEVRQALNYAIDKQLLSEAIFHKQAASAGMDFPAKEFFDIPAYPYDPDKARQLLNDAGYPKGFSLTLKTFESSPGADLPLIAEVVAQFWQKIGIDARVIPVDWTTLRSSIVAGKSNNSLWTHRGLAFSNAALGLQMSSSANSIFATYADEKTEDYLERIAKELDIQRREKLITEMGMYLQEQAAAIYLGFANEPFAVSARIKSWPRISDHLNNFDLVTIKE